MSTHKVAVLMGSVKDEAKVEPCLDMLRRFGIEHDVHVASAHRSPAKVAALAGRARADGYGVIIAAAGKAAHLAGAVAANTTIPVIGIPIAAGGMGGLDALLSTVQMPTGIPVATVGVDGAANAGLLAVSILSLGDEELTAALAEYRVEMAG